MGRSGTLLASPAKTVSFRFSESLAPCCQKEKERKEGAEPLITRIRSVKGWPGRRQSGSTKGDVLSEVPDVGLESLETGARQTSWTQEEGEMPEM